MKELKAIKNYVVIKQDECTINNAEYAITRGSNLQQKPNTGVIESVGTGSVALDGSLIPMSVKKGQRVLFYNFAGTAVTIEEKTFIVLAETDIMCIIEDK